MWPGIRAPSRSLRWTRRSASCSFASGDLRPAHGEADRLGPDEDEHLELERMAWRDAVDAARDGRIVDAKSIVGLLWLARLKDAGEA